jgi:hypothetical protein
VSAGAIPDEVLDRLAAAVGLTLDPAYRAGVAESLARLLAAGAVVAAANVPDSAEPAPGFEA